MKNNLYQKLPIFLDKIKTIRYGDKILLGIDSALIELVNSDKIEFQSAIQDDHYVLIGPKIIESMIDQSKPWEVSNVVKTV